MHRSLAQATSSASYRWMTTGVPRRRKRLRVPSAAAETRRHPAGAAVPIEDGLFVPWIASWSPPLQPAGRLGWWPESPNAYQPNGPYGSPVATRSVTLKRPVGVGVDAAPIADLNTTSGPRPFI